MKHARSVAATSSRSLRTARPAASKACVAGPSTVQSSRPISRSFAPSTSHPSAFRPTTPALRTKKPQDEGSLEKSDEDARKADTEKGSEVTAGINEAGDIVPEEPPKASTSASKVDDKPEVQASSSAPSSSAPPPGSPPPPSSTPPSDGGNAGGAQSTDITARTVPAVYPQVLAIPMARRPLFPGHYKAVQIRNRAVVAAIHEMKQRGNAYVGVFLTKDDASTDDIITDPNQVHPIGLFCQLTADYTSTTTIDADRKKDEVHTFVLYPHRRIRITDYVFPKGTSAEPAAEVADKATESPRPTPTFETGYLHDMGVSLVNVENVEQPAYNKDDTTIEALRSEIISTIKEMTQSSPIFRDQIANFSENLTARSTFSDAEHIANFAGAISNATKSEDLQALHEATSMEDRLHRALEVLKKELLAIQLQAKISRDVDGRIMKNQRLFFLREQLQSLRKELGYESEGKDKTIEKLVDKADSLEMPKAVRKAFDDELSKLKASEQHSSETNVIRSYLEWLVAMPWGQRSSDNFDMPRADTVLEEDHYGLKDVKDRIMEFIAVGKLKGVFNGKILCLVGPPGVGKTSIGKSIARALDRQYYRFAVGGLYDVSEIKGHRRTYVGAMPGRIVQAFKSVQTENPMILIDEIDKLNKGMHGDPAAALLEVLDPEQNKAFSDHYLDVPLDLSRVLFVCTANTTSTISRPLLDRMEVIDVSGYIADEKMAIAERHLVPELKEKNGLANANVNLTHEAIDRLIRHYCSESGVRKLKQYIDKVFRKAAKKILDALPAAHVAAHEATEAPEAKSEDGTVKSVTIDNAVPEKATTADSPTPETSSPTASATGKPVKSETRKATTEDPKPLPIPDDVSLTIGPEDLVDFLGPAPYKKDRIYTASAPPGVVIGLGYRGDGSGSIMPIETASMPGKGTQLTGKLGDVIKESTTIALSFVRSHAAALGLTETADKDVTADVKLHLHMPEGATGKDGPSAGVAFVTAFVGLFSKKSIVDDMAMTGEVSLGGKVLSVGGLKEKLLAARREGIKTVIVPKLNEPDIIHDVPASVKEGLDIIYASDVRDVLRVAFAAYPDLVEKIESLPLGPKQTMGNAEPAGIERPAVQMG